MKTWKQILLFELWLLVFMPILALGIMFAAAGLERTGIGSFGAGLFIIMSLFVFWGWQWYAYVQYRHCRQEEFLFILQTATATQAPVEQLLRAYLNDRPREHLFRAIALFFVFPGYYWIHLNRSFDARLSRVMTMLERGVPLDEVLERVPGIVTRETALAATVGQYTGKLGQVMKRLPEGRATPVWLEVMPRLMYPLLLLGFMVNIVSFVMIFIIPKFEKIFLEFRMKLPFLTELLIVVSRVCGSHWYLVALLWLLALALLNAWLFSSHVRWHAPILGRLYRMKVRGEFLQMLGIMLETGRPLREILENMLDSHLLPGVVQARVAGLLAGLNQGQPLAESLVRHDLATRPAQGLIASAAKASNLPWALQEIGDASIRRSARISYRAAMTVFPLTIFACAGLIAMIAIAMFSPLTALLGGLSGG